MGNRAVITTPDNVVGIYVHWNGGIESVLAFTNAAKAMGVRSPHCDDSYFLARLTQIIGNFFGGTTSVGVCPVDSMGGLDNGVWVVHDFDEIHQGPAKYSLDVLTGEAKAKALGMIELIVTNQQAAFDDSDWRSDVVLTRVKHTGE